MHVTGTSTAYDFLRSTTRFNTRRVSQLVTADVLLLAGADDHYVPLKQLRRQAANLVRARSVTTRTFTAAEQASNHCQVGNIGAAVRVIQAWLELSTISRMAEKADATEELARALTFAHHQRCAVILERDGVVRRLRVWVKGLQSANGDPGLPVQNHSTCVGQRESSRTSANRSRSFSLGQPVLTAARVNASLGLNSGTSARAASSKRQPITPVRVAPGNGHVHACSGFGPAVKTLVLDSDAAAQAPAPPWGGHAGRPAVAQPAVGRLGPRRRLRFSRPPALVPRPSTPAPRLQQ